MKRKRVWSTTWVNLIKIQETYGGSKHLQLASMKDMDMAWTWHGWCNRFGRPPLKRDCTSACSSATAWDLHSWVAPARFTDHIYLVVLRRHPSLLDPTKYSLHRTLAENTNTKTLQNWWENKTMIFQPLYRCLPFFFGGWKFHGIYFLCNISQSSKFFALLFSDVSIPNSTSKWICWDFSVKNRRMKKPPGTSGKRNGQNFSSASGDEKGRPQAGGSFSEDDRWICRY